MNRKKFRGLLCFLSAGLAVFAGSPAAAALPQGEELRGRPAPAFVSGTGVNMRTGPSTSFKSLGKLSERASDELVAVDAAEGEDGKTWFLVLSERTGEGWIRGDFLRFEGMDNHLWRFITLVRRDIGVTPAMAVTRLGQPEKTQSRSFRPEDRPDEVTETELLYPGGTVVFWVLKDRAFLVSADFTGGISGFGKVTFGTDVDDVEKTLGPPHGVRNRVWTYHSGMSRIHIRFGMDTRVDRLILERDPY